MTTAQGSDTIEVRFSDKIRVATFSDHERAAVSRFMTALFEGTLPLPGYIEMVAQHHYAYSVLEGAADRLVDHPIAGLFVDEALRRLPSLDTDLVALAGEDWRDLHPPTAGTAAYCERMEAVCVDSPERFVAHHYTRYLGDLSGGQMIGSVTRGTYGFEEGAGAAFYEFADIADPGAYKQAYREHLDTAPFTDEERVNLLDEVRIAYGLNTDVFVDLDEMLHGGSFG